MSMLATAMFAAAIVSAGGTNAPVNPNSDPQGATLRFVSSGAVLAGISFGMNSVDGRMLVLDQRTSTHLAGGRQTIWYSCPNEPTLQDAAVTFDFVPGKRYELVCRSGQAAQVRIAEGC